METLRFLKRQVRRYPALASALQGPSVALTLAARRLRMRYLYGETHASLERIHAFIAGRVERGEPAMVGKLGTLEGELLMHDSRRGPGGRRRPIPPELRRLAFVNVGLFPDTDASLWRCIDTIREALGHLDVMGIFGHAGERALIRRDCHALELTGELGWFEPWLAPRPWTRALAGKRVLVVHPFVDTIRRQYEGARTGIWPGRADLLLPEMELLTLRMPLSPAIAPPAEPDWHARLERLRAEMDALSYDVALVGAGGMSLPLVAHARAAGAVGIHMGGSTQVLFGIRGRRWDDSSEYASYFNDAWVRPAPEETPDASTSIEGGCYW